MCAASCPAVTSADCGPPQLDTTTAAPSRKSGLFRTGDLERSKVTANLDADSTPSPVDCTTLEPTGETPTIIDPASVRNEGTKYALNWQTQSSWVGSCRRLTLRIPAANDAVAYFRFK
jgi:hypothetical protein